MKPGWWLSIGAGAAACAACCTGPIIGLLGSIGIASAVGAVFVPVLILLVVLAGAAGAWLLVRRRRTSAASAASSDPTERGLPAIRRDLTLRPRR
jgi:hypothetical protein